MRSGKLLSKNDELIRDFLSRPHIEVSSNGQIYSFYSSKFLKGYVSHDCVYHGFRIPGPGRVTRKLLASRIIYQALKGELEADLVVHHIDFNTLNNHPDNLELITQAESNLRGVRLNDKRPNVGYRKLNEHQVLQIRNFRKAGFSYKKIIGKIFHLHKITICKSTISYIVNEKTWVKGKDVCLSKETIKGKFNVKSKRNSKPAQE